MRLTDLDKVLRDAGVPVVEVAGWRDRGRGGDGGQYLAGRPTHVMVHHTAGSAGASASSEVNYMVNVADAKPIANLYVARDADKGGAAAAWIMAAGPTNTNGKGTAPWANGLVAENDMNRHAVGIEIGCNGVGEAYGPKQQQTVVDACAALCRAYSIPVGQVRAHFEYTSRKIDPTGPSQWSPNGGKWNMDEFRSSVFQRIVEMDGGKPAPEPEPEPEKPKPEKPSKPVEGVENVNPSAYYINKGDSPWSVATIVYGSGSKHDQLDAAAFNAHSTPGKPVFVDTPGVKGTRTAVLNGEGAAAIIRRLVGSDAWPTADQFETFYAWNGGEGRTLHAGDVVNMPS